METEDFVLDSFHNALKNFLMQPTDDNKEKLAIDAFEVSRLGGLLLAKETPNAEATPEAIGDRSESLVKKALENKAYDINNLNLLDEFVNELILKERKEGKTGGSVVLQLAYGELQNPAREVHPQSPEPPTQQQADADDIRYQILTAIHAIDSDGIRLYTNENHRSVGIATVELANTLAMETNKYFASPQKDHDQKIYQINCMNALVKYAETPDTQKYRGIKDKVYNFLKLVSCFFVIPGIAHAYKYTQTQQFWSTPRNTTQKNIDTAAEKITELNTWLKR